MTAALHPAPAPGAAARPATPRFALLAVEGVEYALESAWVRRTLPAPGPLPADVAHAGAAFPVVDLRQLFGLAPADSGTAAGERLLLLVERPAGAEPASGAPCRLALVVDDLLGIEPLAASAAVPLPAVYRGSGRQWFEGLLPRAGGRVTVLLRLDGLSPAAASRQGAGGC
jgi:hypothetical protein